MILLFGTRHQQIIEFITKHLFLQKLEADLVEINLSLFYVSDIGRLETETFCQSLVDISGTNLADLL